VTAKHHFFVDPTDVRDGVVALTGAEAHHAAHVLRVRPGEQISVADGTGRILDAIVRTVGRSVDAEVRDVSEVPPVAPSVVLVQGIAKRDKMDVLVQKAVEVGVRSIVPVMCERTVVHWDESRRAKAAARWREVARAAAKQSRSAWMTEVEDIRDVGEVDLRLPAVALDAGGHTRLRDALPRERPDHVSVVIGPEGGLSPAELHALEARGVVTATLGPRILRTETAGPVAAALILYAYGSLG